jgi:hypothetical protein
MTVHTPRLTFASLGGVASDRGVGDSAWRRGDAFNRLLLAAGRRPDACGVAVVGPPLVWLGGYSYLHRDVPLFDLTWAEAAAGWPAVGFGANYVVAPAFLAPRLRAQEIARQGGLTLTRVDLPCGGAPARYTRLFPRPPGVAP